MPLIFLSEEDLPQDLVEVAPSGRRVRKGEANDLLGINDKNSTNLRNYQYEW